MRFTGIIHSRTFQLKELLGNLSNIYPEKIASKFSYKNLEFETRGAPLYKKESKNIFLLFDGMLSNERLLSQELIQLGFPHEESREEILITAYIAFGEDFLKKIEGEFLILLFDQAKEQLLLARDGIGQKGLYWTMLGDYFLFSSDIKGLLATGIVPQTPSLMGFAAYLYFGFIPQDLTPVKDVNKLLPAHFLRVDLKRDVHIEQYFSYSELLKEKERWKEKEIKEQLNLLLEGELDRLLPHEKKVVFDTTGDLASLALLGLYEKRRGKSEVALTFFDKEKAEQAAKTFSERGNAIDLALMDPQKAMDNLVKIVWELDEPIADLNVLRTWLLAQSLNDHTDFLVTTLGADEMLMTAHRYFGEEYLPSFSPSPSFKLAKLPTKFRENVILPFLRFTRSSAKWDVLRNIETNFDQLAFLGHIALFPGKRRKKVSPRLWRYFDPEVFSLRFHRLARFPTSIDPILYFDIKTELPDLRLFQYERLIGAKGINVIAPFLFPKIFDFFSKIPDPIKWERGILAEMISEAALLSPCDEKKEDYIEKWRLNPLFRSIFASLENGVLAEEGLISRRYIRNELGYPYLSSSNFQELWSLLVLEIWMRLFINAPLSLARADMKVPELLSE